MIQKNPSWQDVDKLNFLKGLLKNEAKDVISGLEITGNNYEVVAADLLKEVRYKIIKDQCSLFSIM